MTTNIISIYGQFHDSCIDKFIIQLEPMNEIKLYIDDVNVNMHGPEEPGILIFSNISNIYMKITEKDFWISGMKQVMTGTVNTIKIYSHDNDNHLMFNYTDVTLLPVGKDKFVFDPLSVGESGN
jgi:hypothetical protein